MPEYREPDVPSKAIDFLARIRGKEHTPGGSAAFAVLDDDMTAQLKSLTKRYDDGERSLALEGAARSFLISYRAMVGESQSGILEKKELAELQDILDRTPRRPTSRHTTFRRPAIRPRWIVTAFVGVVVIVGGAIGIPAAFHADQSGPPAASAPQNPPAQNVPPANTNLQQFQQDWGPWHQITPSDSAPQTGSPALLFMNGGSYYVSGYGLASDTSWQEDLGGNVGSVDVQGNYADITDANNTPYVVGINQPFVLASNPNTVLKIGTTGTVYSINLAGATAHRIAITHNGR